MKSTEYAEPSPACDLLRAHLREIWKPIDWGNAPLEPVPFDTLENVMSATYHTASSLARELGVSIMTVTRCVHRGLIRPARTTSGTMLFTAAQLETLRHHLIKP